MLIQIAIGMIQHLSFIVIEIPNQVRNDILRRDDDALKTMSHCDEGGRSNLNLLLVKALAVCEGFFIIFML